MWMAFFLYGNICRKIAISYHSVEICAEKHLFAWEGWVKTLFGHLVGGRSSILYTCHTLLLENGRNMIKCFWNHNSEKSKSPWLFSSSVYELGHLRFYFHFNLCILPRLQEWVSVSNYHLLRVVKQNLEDNVESEIWGHFWKRAVGKS